MITSLLTPIALVSVQCEFSPQQKIAWAREQSLVIPVLQSNQRKGVAALKKQKLIPVKLNHAISITNEKKLSNYKHFYIVQAAYISEMEGIGFVPKGTSFSSDIDVAGTAYVTSFRLTLGKNTSTLAVVLASQVPISNVVALCGAAS